MASARDTVKDLAALADIQIDGSRPWDITVHDERFYNRVLSGGSLTLGESYVDGWWDVPSVDEFTVHVLRARLDKKTRPKLSLIFSYLKAHLVNLQSLARAFQVGEAHYDLGNDLYEAMLDKHMVYTCGYFKDTDDLTVAQEQKLDLVCKKIGLKNGDRILDIGCGWGSFAKFAAERYGASVVGITISKEQATLARECCKGLPIEIRVQDYREVDEKFDHIVSLGMFEHVGYKNYRKYFEMARRCLKSDGLFLLHTIGGNVSKHDTDPWIGKYIFPNGMLPSVAQIGEATERLFVVEDWHNFGPDYDKTLMAWFKNFDAAWLAPSGVDGPALRGKYGDPSRLGGRAEADRFYRMWKYYLLACAGSFRSRNTQLWQIVLSPHGVPGGYKSVR